MYLKFNGVPAGLQSGDAITKIEIVWKAGSETEAQAISAGRTVTLNAGTDDAKIAAFQANGYIEGVGSLVSGTTYTPAVRVTESRSGSGAYVGTWTEGTPFTYTQLAAPGSFSVTAPNDVAVLSWSAPAGTVLGYNVYRSATSVGTYGFVASTTGTTFSDQETRGAKTGYYYKVVAYNSTGEGVYTAYATATPTQYANDDFTGASGLIPSSLWIPSNTFTVAGKTVELDGAGKLKVVTGGAGWCKGGVYTRTPFAPGSRVITCDASGTIPAARDLEIGLALYPGTSNALPDTWNNQANVYQIIFFYNGGNTECDYEQWNNSGAKTNGAAGSTITGLSLNKSISLTLNAGATTITVVVGGVTVLTNQALTWTPPATVRLAAWVNNRLGNNTALTHYFDNIVIS